MKILALDPGTHKTGWVHYDGSTHRILSHGVSLNANVLDMIRGDSPVDRPNSWHQQGSRLAIEMIASYGMAVGAEVFETCVWIGRFQQEWYAPNEVRKVFRNEVKVHLCHSTKAKDANVRQALLDLFPATGGGKVPQVGTTKQPGPLFGVATHVWPALGVAITAHALRHVPQRQRVRLL